MNAKERKTKAYLEAYWQGFAEGKKSNETGHMAKLTHWFSEEKASNYANALSDILCWMDGFKCAGGVYAPNSIEPLRDLNIGLKQLLPDERSASQSHT